MRRFLSLAAFILVTLLGTTLGLHSRAGAKSFVTPYRALRLGGQVYPQPPNVGVFANRPTFCSATGQTYYATDTTTLYYSTVAGTSCTWAAISGGGGAVSSVFTRTGAVVATSGDYTCAQVTNCPTGSGVAANQNVLYLSPNCGTQTNCFPVNANGQYVYDAAITSGMSTVVISGTDPPFAAGDVGKSCAFTTASNAGFTTQYNSIYILASTTCTISSFVSSTSVTISTTATQTCSSSTACFFAWASDDTAEISTFWTAVGCNTGILPNGVLWTTKGQFNTTPTCAKAINAGPSLIGQGNANTRIFVAPNFDYTTCTGSANACFGGVTNVSNPIQGEFSRFAIDGLGISNPGTAANTKVGFVLSGQNSYQVNVNAWGANQGTCTTTAIDGDCFTGFVSNGIGTITSNLDIDGAGARGCGIGATQNFMFGGYCGDNAQHNLDILAAQTFTSFGSTFGPDLSVSCQVNIEGAVYKSNADWIGAGVFKPAGNGSASVCAWASAASDFRPVNSFVGGAGTNSNGYACQVSGPTMEALGTIFVGAGTGGAINNVNAGCVETDLGGNIFTNGIVNSVGGKIFGSPSILGTLLTSSPALTSGWSSSTVTSVGAGSNSSHGSFTITEAGTPTTGAIVTLTFPATFLAAPASCTVSAGGTQVLGFVSVGAPSTTSVAFTYTGTLASGNTIITFYNCGS